MNSNKSKQVYTQFNNHIQKTCYYKGLIPLDTNKKELSESLDAHQGQYFTLQILIGFKVNYQWLQLVSGYSVRL